MGDATVNGDMPHSSTLSHFHSYPAVSDTVDTFKSYPAGQKSIDLTNAAYSKFVKPTLPYFSTPASYVSPYVAKADELGDKFLSKVDEKVPIVKSETKEIKSSVMEYAGWPAQKAGETRDWLFNTYNEEYKKCGGNGLGAAVKAALTTSLVVTSDTLHAISDYVTAKKEEAKEIAEKNQGEAKKMVDDAEKYMKDQQAKAEEKMNQ